MACKLPGSILKRQVKCFLFHKSFAHFILKTSQGNVQTFCRTVSMQERGNGIWVDLLASPISTAFPVSVSPSIAMRTVRRANCFWRVINRECRFNLAHLSHLFSPRVRTDWKTRHQWIFTQLVFKATVGQWTNVDQATGWAPPLPKKRKEAISQKGNAWRLLIDIPSGYSSLNTANYRFRRIKYQLKS